MTSTSSKPTSLIKTRLLDKRNGDKHNLSDSCNHRPDPLKPRQNLLKVPTPSPTPKSP
ncbi:13711_t:CDS:1, partial [Cetraspora pellucida]